MARTKGIQVHPTPSLFIRQAHQISRAAYILPATQKQLLTLIVAQVQIRNNGFELLEVGLSDLLAALEIDDSNSEFLRAHVKGLVGAVVEIETDEEWVVHQWISTARYIKSRKVFQFKLHEELLPYVCEVKDFWSKIALADLNKLQGKYSVRLYELVMAAKGFEGQGGNKPGEWFVDLEISDLRVRFKIAPGEYKLTSDFRKKVIEAPVREINRAGVGLQIALDYDRFRRGRSLLGVRLLVKSTRPGEPRNVTPTQEEEDEAALIALNQELYDKLLNDEPSDMFGGELGRKANAFKALKSHPKVKPLPKKRRSPPKPLKG